MILPLVVNPEPLKISARNPYDHFNTPATPCYKKLFDYDPNGQDFWIPLDALHFD